MWNDFVDRLPTLRDLWSRVKSETWWKKAWPLLLLVLVFTVLILAALRFGVGGLLGGLFGRKPEVVRRSNSVPTGKPTTPTNYKGNYDAGKARIEAERADRAAARGGAAGTGDRVRDARGLSARLARAARGPAKRSNGTP